MSLVIASRPPPQSALQPFLAQSDFADAYSVALHDPRETPAEAFARAMAATPAWVTQALALRDRLVRALGVRPVGPMRRQPPALPPNVGDRFGIFEVLAADDDELLLGIDDVHLDVRVSIVKEAGRLVVSTAVRNHNWRGRLYMLPVAHIHPLVVKAMLKRL